MKGIPLLIALVLWSELGASASLAQEERVILVGSVTARFTYGNRSYNIYPMASNIKTPPEQWQFRYLPLLLPEVDQVGKLVLTKTQVGGRWAVSAQFWLDDTTSARSVAYKAIKDGYPAVAAQLKEANVGRIPISDMTFTVTSPGGKFTTEPFNPGAATTYTLTIPANNQADADRIEDWLRSPAGMVSCAYKYGTRNSSKMNFREVKLNLFQGTSLQKKLDGLPKDKDGKVYVHREAIRKLAEGIHLQIDQDAVIENPEAFRDDVVDALIAEWSKQIAVDLTKWAEFKKESVFNPEDLAPDKLTRDFEKSFSYDEDTKQYKLKVDAELGGGVGIGPIQIGGKAKANYSKEELEGHLRQHSLEVELQGNIIKPKMIWLQEVNTADFKQTKKITTRKLYLGENQIAAEKVDLQLGNMLTDQAVHKDLASRVAELTVHANELTGQVNALRKLTSIKKVVAVQDVIETAITGGNGYTTLNRGSVDINVQKKARFLILFTTGGIRTGKGDGSLELRLLLSTVQGDKKILDKSHLREINVDNVRSRSATLSALRELDVGRHTIAVQGTAPGPETITVGNDSTPKLIVIQLD